MSRPEVSGEGTFLFMESPVYQVAAFGVFFGSLILTVLALSGRKIKVFWSFILDPICGFLFYLFPDEFSEKFLAPHLFPILDIIFVIIEQIIFVNVVMYLSRGVILQYCYGRGLKYMICTAIISVLTLTASFFLIGQAIRTNQVGGTWQQSISLCLNFFSFLFTFTAINGHLSDTCLILLRSTLSLAPTFGVVCPALTQILRIILVVLFIGISMFVHDTRGSYHFIKVIFPKCDTEKIGPFIATTCFIYIFTSINYLFAPSLESHELTAITSPLIYMILFLAEAIAGSEKRKV